MWACILYLHAPWMANQSEGTPLALAPKPNKTNLFPNTPTQELMVSMTKQKMVPHGSRSNLVAEQSVLPQLPSADLQVRCARLEFVPE